MGIFRVGGGSPW